MGARFEPNPDGIRQLQAQANALGDKVVAEVTKTHAGKPIGDVERELKRKLRAAGLTPEARGVREYAEQISRAGEA